MFFYGIWSALCVLVGLLVGVPVIAEFSRTHLVPKLPSALLATGLVLIGVVLWMLGQILEGIRRNRHEEARLVYLQYPAPR